MAEEIHGETSRADGLRWHVVVSPTDGELSVSVDRERADAHARSGFMTQGPPAADDVNAWNGVADGLPYFVLVLAGSSVEAVEVLTTTHSPIGIPLSPRTDGTTVGAVPVDDGDIVGLRVWTADGPFERPLRRPQWRPPEPGERPSGWSPT